MTLLRQTLAAVAALLCAGCAAQPAPPVAAPAAPRVAATGAVAAPPFDRAAADPALWKIADEDTTIYLFGTMHALKPDVVWFDDEVARAFGEAEELVVEMVPPPASEMQATVMAQGMRSDGRTLRSTLSPEQTAKLEAAASEYKIPLTVLDRMTPWFAAVTLSALPIQKFGYSPATGAEMTLLNAARTREMPVSGLETFEDQIGYFSKLSEADQIAFLGAALDSLASYESMFTRLERTWATGDIDDTAALMNESMTATPALGQVLLDERNARWATWIEQRLARPGTIMVAVGSGHLAGPQSVQAKLAERGIESERLEQ